MQVKLLPIGGMQKQTKAKTGDKNEGLSPVFARFFENVIS
jgi:hypothetical protein